MLVSHISKSQSLKGMILLGRNKAKFSGRGLWKEEFTPQPLKSVFCPQYMTRPEN